ncbi:MAG: hypothetical protein K6C05_02450 [Anaerovibrio sp.]|nr:hypothetical protein [Anaerovibrio sp.]MCR5175690.1 hypothetical protein [Anaerovibrio sp.]
MAVKKRCIRCLKVVRADGTCQNKNCVLYVPEKEAKKTTKASDSKA